MGFAVVMPPGTPEERDRMVALLQTIRAGEATASSALTKAADFFDAMLAEGIRPADAHEGAGLVAWQMGQSAKAHRHLRACLACDPGRRRVRDTLIFALDLDPDTTAAELWAERRLWWALHGAPLYARRLPHRHDRTPDRVLRVGYVSADFRQHSAGLAMQSLLTGGIPGTETWCYATHPPEHDDAVTVVYQSLTRYQNVTGLSDDALAAQIRRDQIDILVDCSSFTAGNRLTMFCLKPAPVQITAFGYALSTGLDAMDARFSDAVSTGSEPSAEQVIDVGSIIPWAPPGGMVGIRPRADYPVFGSFHRVDKLHAGVLETWGEILRRVPDAVLRCKGTGYMNPDVQAAIRAVVPRVEFEGGTMHRDHLSALGALDVMLEPWPQTGGVTTCEALYMGVPSVTWQGAESRSRAASALLTHVGVTRGIATSRDGYIDAAVAMISDRAALAHDRATLRARLLASPICTGYAERVSAAYRSLWRAWCASDRQEN